MIDVLAREKKRRTCTVRPPAGLCVEGVRGPAILISKNGLAYRVLLVGMTRSKRMTAVGAGVEAARLRHLDILVLVAVDVLPAGVIPVLALAVVLGRRLDALRLDLRDELFGVLE